METGASLKHIEVLVIEDESGDILLMKQALAREPVPISIHVAVDGKQAWEILERGEFKPEVIILDLNLPKLSGLGFLQSYKPQAPVIVFTSSSNPHDRERALALGAKEYIEKPSDLGEYTRLVSQIVRNWARTDEATQRAWGT
jgi:two-component system, chemotaxis family, response regulator Rcp1